MTAPPTAAQRRAARLTVATPGLATATLLLVGPRRADLPASVAAVPDWLDGDVGTRVVALVGLAAWALTLWLTVAVVASLAAGAPGLLGRAARPLSTRLAPAVLRRTLHAGIGAGIGLTIVTTSVAGAGLALTASPAAATTRAAAGPSTGPSSSPALAWPDLGRPVGPSTSDPTSVPAPVLASPSATSWPDLERPAGTSQQTMTTPTAPTPTTTSTTPAPPTRPTSPDAPTPAPLRTTLTTDPDGAVVVMHGDTLWDLSASWITASTGDVPTAAQVAVAWPAWYSANRGVIGDDPAHLLPGQRLVPPAATAASP